MYRKKPGLTILLLVLLLLTLIPAPVSAANTGSVSLEQAIRTVKQNFIIPSDYTDLTSGFNSNSNSQSWSLTWSDATGNKGSFSSQVDANTGEIISMNSWNQANNTGKLPAISITAARKIGQELLQRLVPSRIASLQLISADQLIPLTDYGSTYTVRWQRVANGIPVADDGASIEVNLVNGEVISYNLNWNNLKLPAATGTISSDAARSSFINNRMLQLQYMLPSSIRPLVTSQQQQQPILVYRIVHPSNGVIDAFTGTPLELDNNSWLNGRGGEGGATIQSLDSKSASPSVTLTPEELKEISRNEKLISQDQAVTAVKKYINIPAELVLQSFNLQRDWQDRDLITWNMNWSSPSTSAVAVSYYAQVNALTGELTAFYNNSSSSDKSNSDLSQESARQIADSFLEKVQPQRFQQVKLKTQNNSQDNNAAEWSFNYQRVVNGILYPENGININIDRTTKLPCYYNLNWSNKNFPDAKNIISLEAANQIYLQQAPLTLKYALVYNSNGNPQVMRLVYQPQTPADQPQGSLVDANSGTWLDASGKPVSEGAHALAFRDISGHFGEEEITQLGQAGIFGEYGNEFHPDENITLGSLLRAMLSAQEGSDSISALTDQEVLQKALENGWLKNTNISAESTVNRELLAQLLVRYLNIDYLAQVPSMFTIPFKDAASIAPGLKGYAALTFGLGIIKGDGSNFNPSHIVTRAEAAVSLVRTLKVK